MDSAERDPERDEIDANIPLFLRRPRLCDTHQGYSYLSYLSSSLVPHPYLTVTSSQKQIETTNTLSSHSDEINEQGCKLTGLALEKISVFLTLLKLCVNCGIPTNSTMAPQCGNSFFHSCSKQADYGGNRKVWNNCGIS